MLRLYPSRVRDEFGHELEALVLQTWHDESPARSAGGRLVLAGRLIADMVCAAVGFRLDPLRSVLSFRGPTMRALPYDLRLAVRSLSKAPGFTLTTIGVLAVGLAICTAVYTVAEHVLLRPLPYPESDRLVMLWDLKRDNPDFHHVVAPGNIADWRAEARSFTGIGVFNVGTLAIDADGGRERIPGVVVSTNYFDVLGVQPRIGRNFRPSDADAGAPAVIVLSDGFWRRQMGGDPAAIGRVIVSGARHLEIIGVMPAAFQGSDEHYFGRSDFWVPGWGDLEAGGRGGHYLRVIARLRDGVSVDQARGEMAMIAARSAQTLPDTNENWTAIAVPMRDEIGIRLALGARREQVLRLVLGEGLLMAGVGTAIGTAVAYGFAATLSRLLFGVRAHDPLVFTAVPFLLFIVAAAAVWIPARRASTVDPVVALRVD